MTRFYLNLCMHEQRIEDEEGFDLPSVDAARQQAAKEALSLLADDVSLGKLDLRDHIEIADETGSVVATLPFTEVIEIIR